MPLATRFVEVLRNPGEIPSIVAWRKSQFAHGMKSLAANLYRTTYRTLYGLPSIDLDSVAGPPGPAIDPIMDHACLPPHAGSDDHDDVIPLLRIVRAMNPSTVLELGTAHGNTVANICKLSQAHVYTVNAPPEDTTGLFITFALTKDEIGCVYRKHGFQDRVTQIYANTLDFDHSQYFSAPTVDLAIIDACHDTSYVINDFMKVLPAMRKGATVLLHDTHPSMQKHLSGSYMACMKLRRSGYDIKHIKGTWWGIWHKA